MSDRAVDPREASGKCQQCEAPLNRESVVIRDTVGLCDECGKEAAAEDLQSRFPPIYIPAGVGRGRDMEPIDVDLGAEGKAIAEILLSLNVLPGYSISRVIEAVNGLVGGGDSIPPRFKFDSRNLPRDPRAARQFMRAAETFGEGEEDGSP